MIVSSFVQMPVAGVPDAAVIQKAINGSVGSGGMGWLGDAAEGVTPSDTGVYPTDIPTPPIIDTTTIFTMPPPDINNIPTPPTSEGISLDYFHSMGLDTAVPNPASVPAPSQSNTVTVGTPGQSTSAWEQAMVSSLIKTGGQILNNVTVPAGTLAVRSPNGAVTYYRQPTGNAQNLAVGQVGGSLGVGLTGGISSSSILLLGLGVAAFMLFQQGRR
jgi:hypothetical protein